LPRQKVAGFDYEKKPAERLEVPLAERIAGIRAQKAKERARARAKDEHRATQRVSMGSPPYGTAGANRSGTAPRRSAGPAPGPSRAEAVLAWARQTTGRPDHGPGGGRSRRPGGSGRALNGKPGSPR
jgi:hypothetical protein